LVRPAEIKSSSPFDQQLNKFLADPRAETLTIPAPEYQRTQIISTVNRHDSDLSHRLEKTGSPHRLVLTKTPGSWERAVAQFETNIKLQGQVTKLLSADEKASGVKLATLGVSKTT